MTKSKSRPQPIWDVMTILWYDLKMAVYAKKNFGNIELK